MSLPSYVLITPVRNEEGYIEQTIQSVLRQTHRPDRWIIVNDASTDGTDRIVRRYADSTPWIELVQMDDRRERNFASQVYASNAGYDRVRGHGSEFVGVLDADITFEPTYYEKLIERTAQDAGLGITGGAVIDVYGDRCIESRAGSEDHHVAGGVQLFRRACYEDIGGYVPMKYGGQDVAAEVTARMKGWRVRTFPDIKAYNHKPMGEDGHTGVRYGFSEGIRIHSLGTHPVYQAARCLHKVIRDGQGGMQVVALAGYAFGWCLGVHRPVSKEFVAYLRREQMDRLRARLRRPARSGTG